MSDGQTVKLAIRALLEVVQTGAKNIEVAIISSPAQRDLDNGGDGVGMTTEITHLAQEEIEKVVVLIEKEKEDENEVKKKKSAASSSQTQTAAM